MYLNRDISWLSFNERVLQEARDNSVPLYERLKFLGIFSSNLDEFFRVRYPVIVALSKLDKKTRHRSNLMNKADVQDLVHTTINEQLNRFGDILCNELIPALKERNIYFYYNEPIKEQHVAEVKEIFLANVLSFIQPVYLGADTGNNFLPANNQLYFVVSLRLKEADGLKHVAINIPSSKLQRFFELEEIDGKHHVIFIDDIVRYNIKLLFPGNEIESVYSIKFNRDAELSIDNDYAGGLLEKLEKKIAKRNDGKASRLLAEKGIPANLSLFLASLFNVEVSDVFEGGRYHNLSDLMSFPVFDKTLLYKKESPIPYPPISSREDLFSIINERDILLHLPYHAYSPVLSFFNQAAINPDVTEIYITLYRVARESHIVNALISAAKNGKKVTAFIELKARFDEENNIKWSRVMKQAGIKLIYSDASIKVHSKIALVTKKTTEGFQNYSVISTGNFNEVTSAFYTDHVLMTAKEGLSGEIAELFQELAANKKPEDISALKFRELYVTKINLLDKFEKFIGNEIKRQKKGGQGLIRIKVNNLEDPGFIDLLYKASQAGVKINLLVRSICCLIPGVEGMSENITVKRLVDKYLEKRNGCQAYSGYASPG
ncbi:MAG: polyphosphate kinase 1 [Chitinophagaceae bacterium]|nr:MAG: polyphosphate kinase 1 [Chitinophagaceae bacterium]